MIYTLTLNPSIDYIMNVEDFKLGATNRSTNEHIRIGGKGVNVSILLHNLSVKSTVLGFAGGFTGIHVKNELMKYENILESFTMNTNDTRINVKLKGDTETEINGAGAAISQQAIHDLEKNLINLTPADFVILSGSMAFQMPKDWYVKIAQKLSKNKIPFVVDIADQQLLSILKYEPIFIKPNQDEIGAIFQNTNLTEAVIIQYAKELVIKGAKHVIVSRGKDGAILATKDKVYKANVPKGKLIDSVGAGDSMVAGFTYGYYVKKYSIQKAFQYACSCGSATAYTDHLADQAAIMELLDQIIIEEVE